MQIKSLCKLIKKLIKEYNILPENVLGHSDIAPFRKVDPGEKFPWSELYNKGLSYTPIANSKTVDDKLTKMIKRVNLYKYSEDNDILSMLELIGYDTRGVKVKDHKFKLLIQAYQRHFRQSDVLGEIDWETFNLIKQHYKDILT